MIAIRGYFEDNQVRLLEPVPDTAKAGKRARVAVVFLDPYEATPGEAQDLRRDWADDDDSREQASLLATIREELTPYTLRAMETAAETEEDWEAILGRA